MKKFRIGQGVDVHQWEKGKPLKLGGITVPYHSGLKGHSDGDALLHSIIDALCGAAGAGDVGEFFPDTDAKWKDSDSKELTKIVVDELTGRGWTIENVDATVVTEEPKLSPYKSAMKEQIAELLSLQPEDVGVKATTCEELGFLGRGEGLMATAVALLSRDAEGK